MRFREWFYIALITIGLIFGIELFLRVFVPQSYEIEYLAEEKIAGIKSSSGTHRLRPNNRYRNRRPEFENLYEINAEGMRDHATYLNREREPSTTRILLLGDSFTFGEGSPYEQVWGTLVEQGLNSIGRRVEIVKAGISAYDTRTELEYLIDLYEDYKPNYVVVGFLPNDIFTNLPLANSLAMKDDQVDSLQKKIRERAKVVTQGQKKFFELHTLTLAKRLLFYIDAFYIEIYLNTKRAPYFTIPQSDHIREQFEITRQLLIEMQKFCVDRNMGLIVVSIPQQFQVYFKSLGYSSHGTDVSYIDQFFGVLAQEQRFSWIPILQEFAEDYNVYRKDHYYRLDGHLTVYGNRVLSEVVVEKIGSLLP